MSCGRLSRLGLLKNDRSMIVSIKLLNFFSDNTDILVIRPTSTVKIVSTHLLHIYCNDNVTCQFEHICLFKHDIVV